MRGLQIQSSGIGSPTSGIFGFSVEDLSNVILIIKDERGVEIPGVKVTYGVYENEPKPTSSVYKFFIPLGVTNFTISKQGYVSQSFPVNRTSGQIVVVNKVMILNVVPSTVIIRR